MNPPSPLVATWFVYNPLMKIGSRSLMRMNEALYLFLSNMHLIYDNLNVNRFQMYPYSVYPQPTHFRFSIENG